MSDIKGLEEQLAQITTLTNLTEAFEGIASARIQQIRDSVIRSRQFFNELWQIYSQLRLDPSSDMARRQTHSSASRDLAIAITSAGGLSGPIDQKIVDSLVRSVRPERTDIIVFGRHGAALLAEHNLRPARIFDVPEVNQSIDVSPITSLLDRYGHATVFYESFVSLSVQRSAKIELLNAVQTLSKNQKDVTGVINLEQ